MTSTIKLRDFIQDEFNVAKKFSSIQPEVTFLIADEIISEAKTIRKNIIAESFPAYHFHAKKDGKLRRFAITKPYSLNQCIKIVVGARYFYMSFEQIQQFMDHV